MLALSYHYSIYKPTKPRKENNTMKKTLVSTLVLSVLVTGIILPAASADEPYNHPKRQILRAARNGEDALKTLLNSGVNINATDEDGETALMDAADDRNSEVLKLLIANGANVNLADEDGETALMKAADEGRSENVKLLIQAGANINAIDEDGETALDKAIDERNREVIHILQSAGAR